MSKHKTLTGDADIRHPPFLWVPGFTPGIISRETMMLENYTFPCEEKVLNLPMLLQFTQLPALTNSYLDVPVFHIHLSEQWNNTICPNLKEMYN